MNKIRGYVRGYVQLKIVGASPDQVLNYFVKRGIVFWNLKRTDDFTLQFSLYSSNLDAAKEIIHRCLCEIESENGESLSDIFHRIAARWVLALGTVLSIALVLIGQNYLMFFSVSGNETVSGAEIMRALDTLGVHFGVPGPQVKPKYIKDHILNMMPQLQWITVTQNGVMAQVVVRERTPTPQTLERKVLANIIASKPAMITHQSVFEGQPLRSPGDFVSQGDMLVSGVVDLEKRYLVVRARAEIYGQTWYQKSVITPEKCLNKEPTDHSDWCIWLEIGKRRIKIFGNSSIYDADCDKMIIRNTFTLPGNYELPISIMAERRERYAANELQISKDVAESILQQHAQQSVAQELCAGEVLKQEYHVSHADECYRLDARFICHEMIAQAVEGKWNKEDFQND